MVQFIIGNVDEQIPSSNCVERPLVLCSHDESTSQANDSSEKSWVLGDKHHLHKKGVGQVLHQSDVICSPVGWLADVSQTLE